MKKSLGLNHDRQRILTMNHCEHEPTARHIYGVYEIAGRPRDFPMNEVALCDSCGSELWNRIKESVSAQRMHYQVVPLSSHVAHSN